MDRLTEVRALYSLAVVQHKTHPDVKGYVRTLEAESDRLRGELKRTNSMWEDCGRHLENSDKARDEQKADANRQWESAKGCAAHRVGPYRCPVLDPTPAEDE